MKTREITTTHKIALLSTGDEICQGDILNTNLQQIAQRLHDAGMHVGMHAVSPDQITDIESIIRYLLNSHQALIITGGLGPTSDDLTRFALANYLKKPLHFDETTWNEIVTRLNKLGYQTPPDSNRQQALFPEGAVIIPNQRGTASGCQIEHHGQFIFMLPGPPPECLPMIDTAVLPTLQKNHFPQIGYRQSWLLFGVSEGQIAEQLDALLADSHCVTGYRIMYPYVEFKIHTSYLDEFQRVLPLIEKAISPYLISSGKLTASESLKEAIIEHQWVFRLCDTATGGQLEIALRSPQTEKYIYFTSSCSVERGVIEFCSEGLFDYWQQKESRQTALTLTYSFQGQKIKKETQVPHRDSRTKLYATEWVSYQILHLLREHFLHDSRQKKS